MSNEDRILNAKWVIPVTREPIHGGWIRLRHGRIIEIGQGRKSEGEDLGEIALLPQLINAHTHLEFSDCLCPIGEPGLPLARWIGEVVSVREKSGNADREHAITTGLSELADSGTSLAGEISTPPCSYPEIPDKAEGNQYENTSAIHPRVSLVRFAEVLGLSDERANERVEAAVQHNEGQGNTGISPHAPYSTSLSTIRRCAEFARDQNKPLAIHLAESPDERQLVFDGSGPFVDALKSIGAWRDTLFPWNARTYESLIDDLSIAPRSLLIHGNDLTDSEIERIAKYPQMTVVYCPRTHAFFGYEPHPLARLLSAGVRVALGTDSRASNPDLNLWREVQYLLTHRRDIAPECVLKMATKNGAIALGRSDLGHLGQGAQASLGFVCTSADDSDQLYEDFSQADFQVLSDTTA